ncbi:GGDEF domain-containing protein [Paenibacillus rigui]|uniref:Diguanylate cyclase n=1 Tax=Paenibacillus rigui TaxID=554312 RepID=A0A229UW77_9BACL|nr:GGDEF domain-containing protein [Paenibacillus rigui]OXM87658.1 diguanylate cyclase [Paenibacillus rigui]
MYLIPFTNACILIALSYVALKLKNRLFMERYETIIASLLTGFASILLMIPPLPDERLAACFCFAPIIMAGLRFGWKVALPSTILPALYVLEIQEPLTLTYVQIIQSIILPAVVSSLFFRKDPHQYCKMIPYADGIKISAVLVSVRMLLSLFLEQETSVDWFISNAFLLLLTVAAVWVLIMMYNDDNRSLILQRRLELQANQDGLTGLPNLRSFMNMARNTARFHPVTIMMIDIDNFKKYNDTYGHLQGDKLLREVGQVLGAAIHEQDYLARYGGEEFILMSHTTDPEQLSDYAQRLCDAIASHTVYGTDLSTTTISIGVSISRNQHDELLRIISEADEALYTSKALGKNRFTFYADFTIENAAVPPTGSFVSG